MNGKQREIALRMVKDPRLPLEQSDVLDEAFLALRPGIHFDITDEQLDKLSQFVPDLVAEYRRAS